MANEKKRILQLFHVLCEEDRMLRSFELAEKVGVTDRTVKSDIKELSAFAEASGARLHSRKGAGYYIEILDEELFLPVQRQLRIRFTYYQSFGIKEIQSRTNDILRRIIVEENFITIDDIVEELYLTRSSIQEEMKEVNRLLKAYHLSFKKRNEKGPLIKGSEFNRRLLMICIFELHYHEGLTLYKSGEYLTYFEREEKERYHIRHILLKVLRESSIHIIDDFTQRLGRYLCVMASRFKKGHLLEFSTQEARWIQQFPQYDVAKQVIHELGIYPDFIVDENEVLGLALQFLFYADITQDSILHKEYKLVYQECVDFLDHIKKRMIEEYHVDLSKFKEYPNGLITGLVPIMIQKKFHATSHVIKSEILQSEVIRYMPLEMKMAFSIGNLFEEYYQDSISLHNITLLAEKIRQLFSRISYSFHPVRVAVTTQNGIDATKNLASLIESRYKNSFACLDCYELYEMRKLKREEYDYAILSFPYFFYKYEWPYVLIDPVPTQKQMNDICNTVILSGVQLKPILDKIGWEEILIYRDFEFQDIHSFTQLLAFKMGKDSKHIQSIQNELEDIVYATAYNKVSVILLKAIDLRKPVFEIYQLKQSAMFINQEVQMIVVMSIDCKFDKEVIRFYDNLTHQLYLNIENIWMLIENPRIEQMVEIVKESLKAVPFSLD